ncbi:amidase [Tropicimonas sp. IMCC34011]|uniref:amidase n=1 Tax=Tropicimonas sp. IMCC34011 TaxID=2248759 RepID=UPI000E247AED|nr:amidase family protein [Tropicimonas sp. IMCC34011]
MAANWQDMTASGLGRGIEAGQIDPVELTEMYLSTIESHPEGARIYARLTPERARAEAEAASLRARQGVRRHFLDGVPLSWKDLFDSAGTATEGGSALLKGRVPERDAQVLATATAGGSVCLGKTHQTELAFSGLGVNPSTASPPNALDPGRVSGGSSSGAAVSVALGLAPGAIGSDTGGSVRAPAAFNGLVGLKTSVGALPMEGVLPLAPRFDSIGPLARSVEDAAAILSLLSGRRAPDLCGASLSGMRLLICREVAFDGIEDGPAEGFDHARRAFEAAGARVEEGELPFVRDAAGLSPKLFAPEAYGVWKDAIEADPEAMYPPILERFRGGRDLPAAEYVAAWRELDRIRAEWTAATAGYDAVILPTVPILPPLLKDMLADEEAFAERNQLSLRNTRIGNLMGSCSLTLPAGPAMTGVSLLMPPGSEARLLRLGAAAERAIGAR